MCYFLLVIVILFQTELSGIKWRKWQWSETGMVGGGGGGGGGMSSTGEPLDDPLLRSYARCLAADILCVWRRVSAPRHHHHGGVGGGGGDIFDHLGGMMTAVPPQPPPLSLCAAKELWIFWYGEEPDFNNLVAPELISTGK